MSTRCKGCNASFKRSGLYPHFRLSRNPQCELYCLELDGGELDIKMAASRVQPHVIKTKRRKDEMDIDTFAERQLVYTLMRYSTY
jgi:Zn-finger nucleic acid-binding protein